MLTLILHCEICGDQWRHLTSDVCDIHLASSLSLVILNHLRLQQTSQCTLKCAQIEILLHYKVACIACYYRAWNGVRVQLLLRRACHLCWTSRKASWESA